MTKKKSIFDMQIYNILHKALLAIPEEELGVLFSKRELELMELTDYNPLIEDLKYRLGYKRIVPMEVKIND